MGEKTLSWRSRLVAAIGVLAARSTLARMVPSSKWIEEGLPFPLLPKDAQPTSYPHIFTLPRACSQEFYWLFYSNLNMEFNALEGAGGLLPMLWETRNEREIMIVWNYMIAADARFDAIAKKFNLAVPDWIPLARAARLTSENEQGKLAIRAFLAQKKAVRKRQRSTRSNSG